MRATTTLDGGVGVPVHTLAGVGMERGDHREAVFFRTHSRFFAEVDRRRCRLLPTTKGLTR